jgi:peroxiredoxin
MMRDRRVLIPIVAGIVLVLLCLWRVATNKPQDYADQVAAAVFPRPAPVFEALDSGNKLVRLGTYLGRHQIIVLFFDGEKGADNDSELLRLRERFPELQAHNVKVIAVSGALPQQNRAAMERSGTFPFPLISDIDPLSPAGNLRIHKQWGRTTESGKLLTGVFLVDRKGQVVATPQGPRPIPTVDDAINEALK